MTELELLLLKFIEDHRNSLTVTMMQDLLVINNELIMQKGTANV